MKPLATEVKNLFDKVTTSSDNDIVVFCHLRWEFVTQRPQHIINRLAKDRKVLFVEEPIAFDEKTHGTAHLIQVNKNITVIQPHISFEHMTKELKPIVNTYLEELNIQNPILWFYSATFGDMATIDHSLIVYDCMDELAAFKGAPASLITQEKELMAMADVVFTGGKSLYESKKQHHQNVHCFPSSVDSEHFKKSLDSTTQVPQDLAVIKNPIVGFYGVIDERIDLELLKNTAEAMPDVSFVMIGPVVKINEADLPRLPNIYYLGGKSYAELPAYLKGMDIAMMPFALNESTKFISPTKTLEFMAAQKPIISTPIYDVVRDYKQEVSIVSNVEEFINAVNLYLNEPELHKTKRIALEKAVIEKTSWDNTVNKMKNLMAEALEKNSEVEAVQPESVIPNLIRDLHFSNLLKSDAETNSA